jgi:hypothetical protein
MSLLKKIARHFTRSHPPILEPLPPPPSHALPLADQLRYNQEKQRAIREQADRIARMRRLGYDLSVVTRRHPQDDAL